MGYISVTVLTTLALLVVYSFLLCGVQAELQTGDQLGSQQVSSEALHKRRPVAAWIKTLPVRRLKPYAVYRQQPSNDVEFIDDSANIIEKRFDDYGHMR